MSLFLDLIGILVFLLTFLYIYVLLTYNYWKKLGVPYEKPKYKIFGNSLKMVVSKKSRIDVQKEHYNNFKDKDFCGIFQLRTPVLFIRNPDLIEYILIKDFSNFCNRGPEVDTKFEPLAKHLINLRNNDWKMLRTKLIPIFTSCKLKGMFQQISNCADELLKFLKQMGPEEKFEAKTIFSKYTLQVIYNCAFGLDVNMYNEINSKLEIYAKSIFPQSPIANLKLILRSHFPLIMKALNWKLIPEETKDFFMELLSKTIESRGKNGIVGQDFLHLLNELRKKEMMESENNPDKKSLVFDENTLAANAIMFLVAGFETTSVAISFAAYELALNPKIQEKLYQTLKEAFSKTGDEITFDTIKTAPYLYQIIAETLRKYPPIPAIRRELSKTYKFPGTSLILLKNNLVTIPIYSLHHDAEYFPDPEKFDPERFSEENVKNIRKGTYIPFGDGPRMCIGSRFAQLVAQVVIAKLILTFKLRLNEKTKTPISFSESTLFLAPKEEILLHVERRN